MIRLQSCPKGYTQDQDKALPPAETVARVKASLAKSGLDVLAETRRIDTGRLGIPVFLSVCGQDARAVMPTRKQMGKGASPAQAEASALMELMERYSFFTFWAREENFPHATWSEAESLAAPLSDAGAPLMDVRLILHSVADDLDPATARRLLDLVRWRFVRATNIAAGTEVLTPLDWFKTLGEFNGSSAGNSHEESILQGACELVERHVCALVDRDRPTLPTIDPEHLMDPVLQDLYRRFSANGVRVLLKDFTLGMPAPTVAALAYDPATFPQRSELVFTAGTATSPAKAAIRALTEVAQLAGDFETGSVYEASGLPKFTSLEAAAWLQEGPLVRLETLPDLERPDIAEELRLLADGLARLGFPLHSVDTSHPDLSARAHFSFAPGLQFRERDRHASLGLFVGRILAEQADPDEAAVGLDVVEAAYPAAHFAPFFRGLLALRLGETVEALDRFESAEAVQPDAESQALAAFYGAYARTLLEDWRGAEPALDRAIALSPEVKEYFNLRGVAKFKQKRYEDALADFRGALALDNGSATDLANLGVCLKHMGNTVEALERLSAALELDPSLEFARTHLESLLREGS